ncbi:MAG: lipid-binding SYLF domain-containing protein [Planctomycetes bacterium]|nr:lipid-binding SYLF domain-containing protein [Planctomycetota bacterium]
MNRLMITGLIGVLVIGGGCATVPKTAESRAVQSAEVREAISLYKTRDPGIGRFFEKSYGYAVLPKVLKGGLWIGGAHGKGEVFEQNRMVGYCSMSQATLGFSFGGEYFREIIFFRDKEDLDRFKSGNFTFSAQVTGVALSTGAAAKTDYKSGMAVFVLTDVGLMVDASLGGQKFKYIEKYITGQE